jgi:hypothetical protein
MRKHLLLMEFRKTSAFRSIAALTLVCVGFIACQGCVAVRVTQVGIHSPEERPSISLRMYKENPSDRESQEVLDGVTTILYCKTPEGLFKQVTTSTNGNWTLQNAVPGTYRIEVAEKVRINGRTEKINGDRMHTFRLPADKRADIQIVLRKTPTGLVIALAVVFVVLVVVALVAVAANNDSKLPSLPKVPILPPIPKRLPLAVPVPIPLPPPPGPHLPPPLFIDGGVYVVGSASVDRTREAVVPEATRFYPAHEGRDVSAESAVAAWFSVPVTPVLLQGAEPPAITVSGSKSGAVTGVCSYESSKRMIEFHPARPFVPGETVKAVLWGRSVKFGAGNNLSCDYEWTFAIAAP